jgi:hypothetical protein
MKKFVNNTKKNIIVYINSGMYLSSNNANPTETSNSYLNTTYLLTKYVSSSSSDDVNTYPVILLNETGQARFAFSCYENVNASYQYIKFLMGSVIDYNRYFCGSFLFFFFFFVFLIIILFNYIYFIGSENSINLTV